MGLGWEVIGNRSVREDFTEKVKKVGVTSVLEGRAFPAKKAARAKARGRSMSGMFSNGGEADRLLEADCGD